MRCSRSTRTDTMQVTAILLLLFVSNVLAKIGDRDPTTEKSPESKPDVTISTTIAPPTSAVPTTPATAPPTAPPTTPATAPPTAPPTTHATAPPTPPPGIL
ncbi:hypothetical protein B566_EDAN012341, partial [Ephemera danica]